MPTEIIMPQLGESIAEGTLVKWLIPPGGRVEKDQSLLEVETDKVSLEIPSPAGGFLTEILVPEGQTVPVGTLLARLEEQARPPVINRVGGVVVRPLPGGDTREGHHSPAVRQLAKERGVDLSRVRGTGAGGRVTKKDVLDFLESREPAVSPQPSSLSVPRSALSTQRSSISAQESGDQLVPLTPMRKTIAERMVHSRQTAAHVATFFEADFSSIAGVREREKLTYLPFVIHAAARALKDMPMVNASWGESGILLKREIHIGLAVALEDGLLVPVVRHADGKSVTHLGKEVADLAERARAKRLNPEEVQGGTFTITNHGGTGSLFSTPIIHQPQVAILGLGAVQKRPVVINDAIAIRPMAYLSLSFDHRVLDGATADRFMSRIKLHLEASNWEALL